MTIDEKVRKAVALQLWDEFGDGSGERLAKQPREVQALYYGHAWRVLLAASDALREPLNDIAAEWVESVLVGDRLRHLKAIDDTEQQP